MYTIVNTLHKYNNNIIITTIIILQLCNVGLGTLVLVGGKFPQQSAESCDRCTGYK
jgi:hypothetical protein